MYMFKHNRDKYTYLLLLRIVFIFLSRMQKKTNKELEKMNSGERKT